MKKALVLILLLGGTIMSFAQESSTRSLGTFSGIKAGEGIDVILKKGTKESAKVEATGTSPDNVLTEVSGSYLKIHMKDGNFRGRIEVKVYVTYVNIDKLSASSAASIFSEETIKATSLEVSTSSAANIEIAAEANSVTASASSAGEIDIKGKCRSLTADVSSAGEIDAYDLEAESVNAEASSGGSVKANVTKNLVAHASSGGDVRYRGNPDKSVTNASSGGSVKKSN